MTRRLGAFAVVLATACERRETPPAPPRPAPSAVVAPSASSIPAAASASSGARAFGPWVRCYGGFHPGTAPAIDVQRLAMLCGPSVGMHAAWPIAEGEVDEHGPPRTHTLSLARGECARVFAVASVDVADLDVQLVSPEGAVIVEDAIDDRWPIVPPDRAVCVVDPGAYAVRVRARKGKGSYAVQAWVLP